MPGSGDITCVVDHCPATLKNNRWSKTRSGWFFNRDQQNVGFCPDHIPEWVEDWRSKYRPPHGVEEIK